MTNKLINYGLVAKHMACVTSLNISVLEQIRLLLIY